MADSWKLVTPSGDVALNASFSAPQYEPGGADRGAARRRDGLTTYQRSGDGLRTPGPLRLTGRVWSDALNIAAMVGELDEIKEAVASCIRVVRATSAGEYTYGQLAGGPPPAVTPDGLGGFEVEIELWPGRAAASYAPGGGITKVGFSTGSTGTNILAFNAPAGVTSGDYLVAVIAAHTQTTDPTASGWVAAYKYTQDLPFDRVLWIMTRIANGSADDQATFQFNGNTTRTGSLSAYRGVDSASPFVSDIEVYDSNTSTLIAPSVSVDDNSYLVVAAVSGGLSGRLWTFPPGMEKMADFAPNNRIAIGTGDEAITAGPVSGTRTVTRTLSQPGFIVSLGLKPA